MGDDRRADLVELVSLLVLIQGAVALSLSAEAVGGALLLGGGGFGALLSLGGAVLTFALGRRLRRRSRRARRWLMVFQFGWLGSAIVDMGLSVAVAGIGPGPVVLLTRVALPLSVLLLLRRTRSEFLPVSEPGGVEVVA